MDKDGHKICTCQHELHDHTEAPYENSTPGVYGCTLCNCIAFRLEEARLLR
jgi:hypothetical protein